jgi:hypothetical protein
LTFGIILAADCKLKSFPVDKLFGIDRGRLGEMPRLNV